MHPQDKEGQQLPELHSKEHCQKVKGDEPSSLLSPGEAMSAVLCPVLGSPGQGRYGLKGGRKSSRG